MGISGLRRNNRNGGDKMIYNNVPYLKDNDSFLEENNFMSYLKIIFQKLKLKMYSRMRSRNYELQDTMIGEIGSLSQLYLEILTDVLSGLDAIIDELNYNSRYNSNLEKVYIEPLTNLELKLDSIQMHLIRIKSILNKDYFRYNRRTKVETLIQSNNRNLNLIMQIRYKIDKLDKMTNNTRFYTEINEKYNNYSKILIWITFINVVFIFLNLPLYPSIVALLVSIISLLGYIGFRYSKDATNRHYFKKITNNKDCSEV